MRLLRRNSMAALDLHLPVAVAAAGPEAPPGLPAGPTSGDVTAARSGAVLGGCWGCWGCCVWGVRSYIVMNVAPPSPRLPAFTDIGNNASTMLLYLATPSLLN